MTHYDLVIIGTGSGNSIPPTLSAGKKLALVEKGVFGGTCLNVGCIPSKMFIYAADVARQISESEKYGVHASLDDVDWPSIVDRVFGRIDPIAAGGEEYRTSHEDNANIDVYQGHGAFVGHKELGIDLHDGSSATITADQFLLAAGARVFVPPIPGLDDIDFHTSDTVMRLPELPERMIVVGGGYIAAELGHVFASFGVDVTMLVRGPKMLRGEDAAVSDAYTEASRHRFDLRLGVHIERFERDADGRAVAHITEDGATSSVTADVVLVATGRIPNSDTLAVEKTGVRVDPAGRVIVHENLETDVSGIYALGDLTNSFQLKHVANAEAKVAFWNLEHPDDQRTMDYSIVPHAVFGSPQVASVGLTEEEAAHDGVPYVCAVKDYGSTAYGWAMEDSTSFVKLVAHAHTRKLLGAHIIGPQASTLIQTLIQGMRFGSTVDEMAKEQMWIHPALTEVVENALLDL